MVFLSSMASKKSKSEEYPAFTNFTIKVDVEGSWAKTVKKVLNSVQGVTNFRMENNGNVNISGYIDPILLLKCLEKAGKTAEIVHWQYGECSRNLFEKPKLPSPSVNNNNLYLPGYEGYNNNGYYGYNYNNGYGYGYGYPPNYRRSNYVFNHLECSGNASDCSGHHMRNPNTPNKSSSSSSSSKTQFQKPASGHIGNHPTCCSLM
ncbi:uncharacterized protein LOC128132578 [Lactuca sativa]|uniref:uncharacterized protein LOC111919164 n=1 Tax=Lactuca sativa TaxID=4236 RepID=UPI001C68EAF7|nr:uncharacterized protein LOC111919164 [Lactuca sativa]XP_052625146.1 uncharacterized protein LOC128132578 [Lactuca sativa]